MSKAQLGRLIDLPDESLQELLDYAKTLSKADAAKNFENLLGDSPAAVEFISAFNTRRHDPAAGSASAVVAASASSAATANSTRGGSTEHTDAAPGRQRQKKKKAPLHTPAARQVTSLAPPPGAVYNKKGIEDDYMSGRSGPSTPSAVAGAGIPRGATPVSASATTAVQPPPPQQSSSHKPKQQHPAGGSLISDALAPKPKNKSSAGSGAGAVTKISITGGTAMHGAATALADFDAAIRSLEVSTNPTLAGHSSKGDNSEDSIAARRCNCVATRHPLQTAAPNCTSCGKVICVKEGLGPCTSCGTPLLSAAEVQAMIKELRAERGREKMAADREAHQRAAVAGGGGKNKMGASTAYAHPRMIAGATKWGGDDDGFVSLAEAAKTQEVQHETAEAKARAHRDKLLAYQAQNAQRTTVRDEAADFDVGDALAAENGSFGQNLWATPEERAKKLRQQQKLLREMEWNARPEYEKRQQVLSIDVSGRKVFRKMAAVERPPTPKSEEDEDNENDEYRVGGRSALTDADGNKVSGSNAGGAFSKNPLLGRLIKPVYDARSRAQEEEPKGGKTKQKGKGKGKPGDAKEESSASSSTEAPLRGRADDPAGANRWRRVQDDVDNEAVILDGGIYGSAPPVAALVGDEPECG